MLGGGKRRGESYVQEAAMTQPALRPFQRTFLRHALAPGVDMAALSIPRGNGKTWLGAHILTRCLTPGDRLFESGKEYLLLAGSLEQARLTFRFIRETLEPQGGYRFLDSAQRIGITHMASNTKLRVISSNAKQAFGIVNTPIVLCDEPGTWEVVGGTMMSDALETAQGKPGSPLRVIYIGTIAPAQMGWWPQMIQRGSHGSAYVQSLQGDRDKWDTWNEIRRCNPLTAISPEFRRKLLEERDSARGDTRLKARFLSYRLNVPTADESELLLTVDDYQHWIARPVPARMGQPIVGVDLGGGRAWSAAVAVWQSGRMEALAVAPGIPDLEGQERRDRVASGTYQALAESGLLRVAEGLHVQPPGQLWDAIRAEWGQPVKLVLDRFRLKNMADATGGVVTLEPRVWQWSSASEDIRGLRAGVKDGPLALAEESRPLVAASLAVAMVKNDESGNVRLVKRGTNNQARDDVAASLTLAAGAFQRASVNVPTVSHVVV